MLFHGCAQMFVKCGFSFHQSMAWRASSNPTCKVSSSRPRQHPFTHRGPPGAHHARSRGAYHARSLGALLPQFREEGPARGNLCLAVATWALIGCSDHLPGAGSVDRARSPLQWGAFLGACDTAPFITGPLRHPQRHP